ncbi:MAG TPA: hypothetical protein PLQ35_09770 [bacterium]|nr:hypothetical protein [bacterium]HQL62570.1 hypothetical protein [bacterium]
MKRLVVVILFVLSGTVVSRSVSAQRTGGSMGFGQSQFGSSSSLSSSSVQRIYYGQGTIGEAVIEADRDSRSIIVISDDYSNEHIRQIIESLDRPIQQVLIKVVFAEVTYRDDVDIGVEGMLDINGDRPGSNVFETAYGLAAESRGSFYKLLEDDVNVTLRAIQEAGKLEVLSRPSILTRNNQEAVITVGKEVPFITNSRVTSDGQTINTVEYEDIGIILRVTPFITKEGLVEMILAPEISTITDETVPISDTINSPVFAKRSADTVVVTPNGQTVVIGGMMSDNTTETRNKVPVLGDIPGLGLLFQRKVKGSEKTELLIFLTPYVVEGPEKLVDVTAKERSESELMPQAFPEDQFTKFMDGLPEAQVKKSSDEPTSDTKPAPSDDNTSKNSNTKKSRKNQSRTRS